jgi:hypothetical protein
LIISCFRLLWINSAARNIDGQVLCEYKFVFLWDKCLGTQRLALM